MRAPIGDFTDAWPVTDKLDLLAPPVAAALRGPVPADGVVYVDSDPDDADTARFGEVHGIPPEQSANCVVVAGRRGQETTLAACVVLAHTRADVHRLVRREPGARKASFAPMDTAVGESGMEYGGITPIGLPEDWPLLVDAAVTEAEYVVIGSGRRRGKLLVPGKLLAHLPGARVLEGLGVPVG